MLAGLFCNFDIVVTIKKQHNRKVYKSLLNSKKTMENEYSPVNGPVGDCNFVHYETMKLDIESLILQEISSKPELKLAMAELNKFYRESYIKYN